MNHPLTACISEIELLEGRIREKNTRIEQLEAENADLRRWKALDKPITAAMSIANSHLAPLHARIEQLEERMRGADALIVLWETRATRAEARIEQLEAALREIGDMHALSQLPTAVTIARAALDQSSPPKATDCECPVGMHSIGCHNR